MNGTQIYLKPRKTINGHYVLIQADILFPSRLSELEYLYKLEQVPQVNTLLVLERQSINPISKQAHLCYTGQNCPVFISFNMKVVIYWSVTEIKAFL